MEPTSLTRTLKTLEDKGYIVRRKNPDDGRGVLIYLTEAGRQKRELSKATVLKFNEILESRISAEKLDVFREVTDQISQLIAEKKIF
jgi:DNA-binding MarR family transcriptional regulator